MHLGWWKDEEEPFQAQWEKLSAGGGCKVKIVFLMGEILHSEADACGGRGYDLILRSGWRRIPYGTMKGTMATPSWKPHGWRDAPDAAAKKRIDQIWCSKAVPVKSSRVVFNGLQEPQVS